MARVRLSLSEARRIAVAAQGLHKQGDPRAVDARHLRRAIHTTGLLQLDFVNVLVPAHYLVVYSRVGAYDRLRLHRTIYHRGEFTEQWAHEACIVPMQLWPLLAHRREGFKPWPNSPITKLKNKDKYTSEVYDFVKKNGATVSQDLPPAAMPPRRRPGDWRRSLPRWALEYHFGGGALAVKDRLSNFQRVYDLSERIIPERARGETPSEPDAQRALLEVAARACGVGTLADLADYFRMSTRVAAPRIAELVEEGRLTPVSVDGWDEPAYLHNKAKLPRRAARATVLSPFDPLVWFRPRGERLFDFEYRIEIYVPAAKRRWGYYVLPFLQGERLTGRVDLKADRKQGTLMVPAVYREAHADEAATAAAMAAELQKIATWLGLEHIKVGRRGNLANALRRELR